MLRQEEAMDILVPNITYRFDHNKIHVGDYLLTSKHTVSKVKSVGGAYIEMTDGTSDYSDVLRPICSGVLAIEELGENVFVDALNFSQEIKIKDIDYVHLVQEYIRDKYEIEIPLAKNRLEEMGVEYINL